MKKIILCAALLFTPLAAKAQYYLPVPPVYVPPPVVVPYPYGYRGYYGRPYYYRYGYRGGYGYRGYGYRYGHR